MTALTPAQGRIYRDPREWRKTDQTCATADDEIIATLRAQLGKANQENNRLRITNGDLRAENIQLREMVTRYQEGVSDGS